MALTLIVALVVALDTQIRGKAAAIVQDQKPTLKNLGDTINVNAPMIKLLDGDSSEVPWETR